MDVVRKQIVKLRGRIDIVIPAWQWHHIHHQIAAHDGGYRRPRRGSRSAPVHRSDIRREGDASGPPRNALSTVPDGGEMVLVRGSLLPILRLHRRFDVVPRSEDPSEGVLIVVESRSRKLLPAWSTS